MWMVSKVVRCRGLQGTKASFAAVDLYIALGGTRAFNSQIKKKVRKRKKKKTLRSLTELEGEPLAIKRT